MVDIFSLYKTLTICLLYSDDQLKAINVGSFPGVIFIHLTEVGMM